MRINGLEIKNGEQVSIGKFTILIGPNNVGKSQTLKDIHNKFVKQDGMATTILESLEFDETPSLDYFLTGVDVRPNVIELVTFVQRYHIITVHKHTRNTPHETSAKTNGWHAQRDPDWKLYIK